MNKEEAALKSSKSEIHSKKNVIGTGTGLKIKNGKVTDEEAILVFVSKKENRSSILKKDKIPSKIDDIKTDVVAGEMLPMSMHRRPFMQGDEIGPNGFPICGTLGLIFRMHGEDYGLTNWHVCTSQYSNQDKDDIIGIKVCQPGGGAGVVKRLPDGSLSDNLYIIGTVERYIAPTSRICDAAIFRITTNKTDPIKPDMGYNAKGSDWDRMVDIYIEAWPSYGIAAPMIGFPHHHQEFDGNIRNLDVENQNVPFATGFGKSEVGDILWKSSRTTGVKKGIIISRNTSIAINYGAINYPRVLYLDNQTIIHRPPDYPDSYINNAGGDSGSCWMDESNRVTELHFAGTSEISIATSINKIFNTLYTPEELYGYNMNMDNGWNLDVSEYDDMT